MSNKCYTTTDILLPDFSKVKGYQWAVIACDQFTSQPEYWEKVKKEVSSSPSTLNITLPEVYLDDAENLIPKINQTMTEYLSEVLKPIKDTAIYVERTQSNGSIRKGVVMAIDLENYDYHKGAKSLIRATEATVEERIPPRVAIRRNAEIELPHVMLLIDDPGKTAIEPLSTSCNGEIVYDTDLMLNGGHVKGRVMSKENVENFSKALDSLITPENIESRYGDKDLTPLLFAVGDGNHSLATAKASYEEIKSQIGKEKALTHPARYALVEIVNIHDDSLKFEPIYRVMFNVNPQKVLEELKIYVNSLNGSASEQIVDCYYGKNKERLVIKKPTLQLTVATLQNFIDDYLLKNKDAVVDYIHGESSVVELSSKENAIGFIFSGMGKVELFKTVMYDGALPRKTFSMGHAEDKRYYLECRKIK